MKWNQSKAELMERLHDVCEDGIDRVQRTTEDFEIRMREEIDALARRARDAAQRGKERTVQLTDDIADQARENPMLAVLAAAGLVLALGGLWVAATRIRKH